MAAKRRPVVLVLAGAHCNAVSSSLLQQLGWGHESTDDAGAVRRIDTKYYTADVTFTPLELVDEAGWSNVLNESIVQAVVLVIRSTDLDLCHPVFKRLDPVESKVCVGDIFSKEHENRLIELGIECVGEEECLSRVKEVLEVTMWANMERKIKKIIKNDGIKIKKGDDEKNDERASGDKDLIVSDDDKDKWLSDDRDKWLDISEDEDVLGKMVGEIRQIKGKLVDMPHDERRNAAAEMALKFAALLGIEE